MKVCRTVCCYLMPLLALHHETSDFSACNPKQWLKFVLIQRSKSWQTSRLPSVWLVNQQICFRLCFRIMSIVTFIGRVCVE